MGGVRITERQPEPYTNFRVGGGGFSLVLICALCTPAASASQSFLPVLLPGGTTTCFLPTPSLPSPGSFSIPANTPDCLSGRAEGGQGKEGGTWRPKGYGGGGGWPERGGEICVFLGPWAQTSPPPHLVLWGWTSQPSCACLGRENIRASFLAFGLKVPVPAKESELQGTISVKATYPVALDKSFL